MEAKMDQLSALDFKCWTQVSPLLTSRRRRRCHRWMRPPRHHGRSARKVAPPEVPHRSTHQRRRREPLGMDASRLVHHDSWCFFLENEWFGYSKLNQLKQQKMIVYIYIYWIYTYIYICRHRHFWWVRFSEWLHTVCLNEVRYMVETYR